jgi:hypothetical protein
MLLGIFISSSLHLFLCVLDGIRHFYLIQSVLIRIPYYYVCFYYSCKYCLFTQLTVGFSYKPAMVVKDFEVLSFSLSLRYLPESVAIFTMSQFNSVSTNIYYTFTSNDIIRSIDFPAPHVYLIFLNHKGLH